MHKYMSKDGVAFSAQSQQHVLNSAHDMNSRLLRTTSVDSPPFTPSDIVANVNPLEIALSDLPLVSDPYPIAVLSAIDNDFNDQHNFQIITNPHNAFTLLRNPSNQLTDILAINTNIESVGLQAGDVVVLRVRACDSYGLCVEKSFNVNIVATPSVAGPTRIYVSNLSVIDGAGISTAIGNLSSIGGAAPYTFSIISDPDSKFQVVGDVLQLSSGVNRAERFRHNVTLRVTDNNGATYDTTFTVGVNPISINHAVVVDANGRPAVVTNDSVSRNIDLIDVASSTIIYAGQAVRSSIGSEPAWIVTKYDLSTSVIAITKSEPNQIWDNRASLTYE